MKFRNKILSAFLLIFCSGLCFGQNNVSEQANKICNELMKCLNNLPKEFSESQFLGCVKSMEEQYLNDSISDELEKKFKEICSTKIVSVLAKSKKVEKGEKFISDSLINKYDLEINEITSNYLFVTVKEEKIKSEIKIYGFAQEIDSVNEDYLEKEYDLSKNKNLRKKYNNKVERIYIKGGYFNKKFIKEIELEGLHSIFSINISSILIIENGLKNEIVIMHSEKINKKIKSEFIKNAIYQMTKNGY